MRTLLILPVAIMLLSCKGEKDLSTSTARDYVIIGYVPGYAGLLDETQIDPRKLTHINYAFVDVKDSMAWLTNLGTDTVNFRKLNYLKKENPDLKLMISIGGWSWSENFSDAVLTPSSRKKFAQTSAALVEQYDLDGIDIDWEYPGLRGEDNVYRTEDKQNFTRMFEELRKELDALTSKTGKTYLLTTAIPCFSHFIEITEMGKASEYLDYVNLMAYDFFVAGDTAGHHANLFFSENYKKEDSGDRAFKEYTAAGVPARKLVLGLPFYGRSWFMRSSDNYGINRPVDSVTRGGGFTYIKDSVMIKPGFVRHWDDKAKAPVLWNEATKQMISYEDEESVRYKCDYVRENNMGGVMFWQYMSDPKEYLLDAVNQALKK